MPHSPLTARTAVGGGVDRHDAASPPAKVRWPACGVPRFRQTAKHYWNRTPARPRYTPDRRFFRGAARTHEQNTEPRDYRRGVSTRRAPASTDGTVCATDETQGFMKVLVGGSDDQILGFTTVGAEAGEVMAVVQTAMLASVPHVTPPRIGNRNGLAEHADRGRQAQFRLLAEPWADGRERGEPIRDIAAASTSATARFRGFAM